MTRNLSAETEQLRAKLDVIIHYLERLDLYYHAHGADFTPPGWDMTVQEMIGRLKDDSAPGASESPASTR